MKTSHAALIGVAAVGAGLLLYFSWKKNSIDEDRGKRSNAPVKDAAPEEKPTENISLGEGTRSQARPTR